MPRGSCGAARSLQSLDSDDALIRMLRFRTPMSRIEQRPRMIVCERPTELLPGGGPGAARAAARRSLVGPARVSRTCDLGVVEIDCVFNAYFPPGLSRGGAARCMAQNIMAVRARRARARGVVCPRSVPRAARGARRRVSAPSRARDGHCGLRRARPIIVTIPALDPHSSTLGRANKLMGRSRANDRPQPRPRAQIAAAVH